MGKPVKSSPKEQQVTGPEVGPPVLGPVDKAMEVLSALVEAGAPHRLGDLALQTGLAKPTVHRLLRALAESGFAEPAAGGSYRAGPRLLGLAASALDGGPELRLVRPVLADLRSRTGLLAHYAVRDRQWALCLDVSEPARDYAVELRPGSREFLLGSAAGLAMMSAWPGAEVQDAFAAAGTETGAVVPAEVLRAETAAAAERGYAVDDQYAQDDLRAVASPVRDGSGRVVGAVALTGLVFTMDDAGVGVYGPMVRAAARSVSAGLGAGGRPRLGVVPEAGGAGEWSARR